MQHVLDGLHQNTHGHRIQNEKSPEWQLVFLVNCFQPKSINHLFLELFFAQSREMEPTSGFEC
jgi:hypothetical protein